MIRKMVSILSFILLLVLMGCGDPWGQCTSCEDATCPDSTCPDATCPDSTDTTDSTDPTEQPADLTVPEHHLFHPCNDLMGTLPTMWHIGPYLYKEGAPVYKQVEIQIENDLCEGRQRANTIWLFNFNTNDATYVGDARYWSFLNYVSLEDEKQMIGLMNINIYFDSSSECFQKYGSYALEYYTLVKRNIYGEDSTELIDPNVLLSEQCYHQFIDNYPYGKKSTSVKLFDFNWEKRTFLLGCRYWLDKDEDPDIAFYEQIWDIYIVNIDTGERQMLCTGRYDGDCWVYSPSSVLPDWDVHYFLLTKAPRDPSSRQHDYDNRNVEIWKWDGHHAKLVYMIPTGTAAGQYLGAVAWPTTDGTTVVTLLREGDHEAKTYTLNLESPEGRTKWKELDIVPGWYVMVDFNVNAKYPWLRAAWGWPKNLGYSISYAHMLSPMGLGVSYLFLYDMDTSTARLVMPPGEFDSTLLVPDEDGRPRYLAATVRGSEGHWCVAWVDLLEQGIVDEEGHLIPDPKLTGSNR